MDDVIPSNLDNSLVLNIFLINIALKKIFNKLNKLTILLLLLLFYGIVESSRKYYMK